MARKYTLPDGRVLTTGAFTLGGIQHPTNWLALATAGDLAGRGITVTEVADPAPAPAPTPNLTPRQFRLGMLSIGITRAMVDGAIAAMPDATERELATIEWEYSTVIQREHPLVGQLATAFGKTAAEIDAAWQASVEL